MFVIDFDDTLFDTHAFKRARMQAVAALGVSEELYWQTYQESRNTSVGVMTYSNRRHMEALERHGFSGEQVLAALQVSIDEAKKYLFSDALDFLQFLRNHKQPLVLLSLGDPAMQELKVRGCGIHDFFERIFFVDTTKIHVMRELATKIPAERIWLINDKVKEIEEILGAFPALKVALRQSASISAEEYVRSGLPFFQTLKDMQVYVESTF